MAYLTYILSQPGDQACPQSSHNKNEVTISYKSMPLAI